MQTYLDALMICLQPANFLMMYAMVVLGCLLGAIPGLSGGIGISLLLPLTFALTKEMSFCMLLGMYVGSCSGSFIAAVLIGIPGSSASIATVFDGFPMTQKGQASKALTIAILGSSIGTFASIIIATLLSGTLADFALSLGPWEYFSLCFMALSMIVGLSSGSVFRSMMGACIGLFLATIGTDPITNVSRYTMGDYHLIAGIPIVVLMLGNYAIKLVTLNYAKGQQTMPSVESESLKGLGLTFEDIRRNIKTIAVSMFTGAFVGFLPGLGTGMAAMVSYGQAKRMSKTPEKFGTGCEEGVWASEVANNACIGGAIIPMIALGIPGDGITLMLLTALQIHGLQPGPMFMSQNPLLSNVIFAALFCSAVLIVVTELLTKRWFPYILKAPYHYLYGTILVICMVGAFTNSNTMYTVWMMFAFGLFAVVLDYAKIPLQPMLMAFILGRNLEQYYRRALSYAAGDVTQFLRRPISCVLLIIGIYSLFNPLVKHLIKKYRAAQAA